MEITTSICIAEYAAFSGLTLILFGLVHFSAANSHYPEDIIDQQASDDDQTSP